MFDIRPGENGPTIRLTRGDYAAFEIGIEDAAGAAYELQEGETVYFTVKQSPKKEEIKIQKVFGCRDELLVELENEDTQGLKYGTYAYDVQLTHANGRPETFIGPASFILTEEVTWDV